MEKLLEQSVANIANMRFSFKRYMLERIDWNNRLIAITGPRGSGKTTLLLQHIKNDLKLKEGFLFASLDNIYFSANRLSDLADSFVKSGGKYLFLDEVHKYPDWSQELKNIYDNYPDLNIVFTGSSILSIYKGFADLSRRAVSYTLTGMSFREFIELETGIVLPVLTLKEVLKNHIEIATGISAKIKPIAEFKNYLRYGYYPFYKENKDSYLNKLSNVINLVLESDLPSVNPIEYKNIFKLKKLLYIIAHSVPFSVNISKLSGSVEVSRNTILLFIEYLRKAEITSPLYDISKGYGYLTKPDKIYLNNTNLSYALAEDFAEIGNLRETFFQNQLSQKHTVGSSNQGDFQIDGNLTFEIGGKNKTIEQIKGVKNSYIAMDDIEIGYKNRIPLWLFGFLY